MPLRVAGVVGAVLSSLLPVLEAASLRRTVAVLSAWGAELMLAAVLSLVLLGVVRVIAATVLALLAVRRLVTVALGRVAVAV